MAAPSPRRVPPPPRWRGHRRAPLIATLLVTGAIAGCSLPTTEVEPPPTDPSEAPIGSSTPDPTRAALVDEVRRLEATVAAAREELATAVGADASSAARAAERTLEVLVADVGALGTDQGDGPRPLFPSESLGRDETEDAADQLTLTLTRARDAGGTLGNTVVDMLRDPIAGDLGAWQRDAAGVLASIDATIEQASTMEERELAIADLPGLGTRAIAWTRLAAATSDADEATAYAERGVANLEVIQVTLERLDLPS